MAFPLDFVCWALQTGAGHLLMSMQLGSPNPESHIQSTRHLRALCYLVPGRARPGHSMCSVPGVPRELPVAPGSTISNKKPGHRGRGGPAHARLGQPWWKLGALQGAVGSKLCELVPVNWPKLSLAVLAVLWLVCTGYRQRADFWVRVAFLFVWVFVLAFFFLLVQHCQVWAS